MSLDAVKPSQLSIELEANRKIRFADEKNGQLVQAKYFYRNDPLPVSQPASSKDFPDLSAYSLFLKVYAIGCSFMNRACKTEGLSLWGRASLFAKGLLFLIPVLNTIAYVVSYHLEQKSLPVAQSSAQSNRYIGAVCCSLHIH